MGRAQPEWPIIIISSFTASALSWIGPHRRRNGVTLWRPKPWRHFFFVIFPPTTKRNFTFSQICAVAIISLQGAQQSRAIMLYILWFMVFGKAFFMSTNRTNSRSSASLGTRSSLGISFSVSRILMFKFSYRLLAVFLYFSCLFSYISHLAHGDIHYLHSTHRVLPGPAASN